MFSLKNKIVILTCISVLFGTLLVGGVNYLRVDQIVLHGAIDQLAGETRLMAQRFKNSYDEMKSDVQVLSQTPPINGIIRATKSFGRDPVDGSSDASWRERLSTIFTSFLLARPYYMQVRFIGVADGGRELVRVNRNVDWIEVVTPDALQAKGDEAYFLDALQTQSGEIHFSEVTYNREQGNLDNALVPTVRAITPIYAADGQIFGMIVVNANYGEMLRNAFAEIEADKDTFVLNRAGDYMKYGRDKTIGPLEFHQAYSVQPPQFIREIAKSEADEQQFVTPEAVSYFVRLKVDPSNPATFLGVVVRVPTTELFATAFNVRNVSLAVGALSILVALLAAWVLATRFTSPLKRMTAEIKHSEGQALEDLPTDRRDEIGELARAFDQRSRQLIESEARVTAIFDNAFDGLITIDDRGIVDSYNRGCERIFGYEAAEVIGQNIKMLMPQPTRAAHDGHLAKYRETGAQRIVGATTEVTAQRKNGEEFPLEIAISELEFNNQRVFSGIVRDISERRQMDIMKDEFISTVNHELRTPLTSIQSALGLLMVKSDGMTTKGRRLLQISYDSCQRLTRLVNDVLDSEKMAAGKMTYDMEPTELCGLVDEIVDSQRAYAEKFGVTLESRCEDGLVVALDRDRFTQALVNLLSNAAKFSQPGDTVEITAAALSGTEVRISVRDHGPGIADSFRAKIFDKFAQADGSATRTKGGTGLGLNITKTIIEALGGSVSFDTEVGKGTVFHFVLPLLNTEQTRRSA